MAPQLEGSETLPKREQRAVPKMNPLEGDVYTKYIRDGWKVLRHGWPDFLLVNGNDLVGVEVKSENDAISDRQHEMLCALRTAMPILHVREGCGLYSDGYRGRKGRRFHVLHYNDFDAADDCLTVQAQFSRFIEMARKLKGGQS